MVTPGLTVTHTGGAQSVLAAHDSKNASCYMNMVNTFFTEEPLREAEAPHGAAGGRRVLASEMASIREAPLWCAGGCRPAGGADAG